MAAHGSIRRLKNMRLLFFAVFSALLAGFSADATAYESNSAYAERFSKNWPDASDLSWFQHAKGQSEEAIVKNYGKPLRKEKLPDGRIRWIYPWTAVAYLEFTSGVVTSVFYTSGF